MGKENKQQGPESSNQYSKYEYFVSWNIAGKIKYHEREAKVDGPNDFCESIPVNDCYSRDSHGCSSVNEPLCLFAFERKRL